MSVAFAIDKSRARKEAYNSESLSALGVVSIELVDEAVVWSLSAAGSTVNPSVDEMSGQLACTRAAFFSLLAGLSNLINAHDKDERKQ